jgi:hypothetical protein
MLFLSQIDRKTLAKEQNAAIDTLTQCQQELDKVWLKMKESEYRQISKVDEAFGKLCEAIDLLEESVDEIFREAV